MPFTENPHVTKPHGRYTKSVSLSGATLPDPTCANYSGVIIDQNAAPTEELSLSGTTSYFQTFQLPKGFIRGEGSEEEAPALSGFQVMVNTSAAEVHASAVEINYLLEVDIPSAGWQPLVSGKAAGVSAIASKVWMDAIFPEEISTQLLEVNEDLSYRIGIQNVQGVKGIWFTTPNPYTLGNGETSAEVELAGSFAFRVLALVADSGTDWLGNPYRAVVRKASGLQPSGSEGKSNYWMSAPQPSKFSVVSHYSDVRPVPEIPFAERINLCSNPSFEYDFVGKSPHVWTTEETYWNTLGANATVRQEGNKKILEVVSKEEDLHRSKTQENIWLQTTGSKLQFLNVEQGKEERLYAVNNESTKRYILFGKISEHALQPYTPSPEPKAMYDCQADGTHAFYAYRNSADTKTYIARATNEFGTLEETWLEIPSAKKSFAVFMTISGTYLYYGWAEEGTGKKYIGRIPKGGIAGEAENTWHELKNPGAYAFEQPFYLGVHGSFIYFGSFGLTGGEKEMWIGKLNVSGAEEEVQWLKIDTHLVEAIAYGEDHIYFSREEKLSRIDYSTKAIVEWAHIATKVKYLAWTKPYIFWITTLKVEGKTTYYIGRTTHELTGATGKEGVGLPATIPVHINKPCTLSAYVRTPHGRGTYNVNVGLGNSTVGENEAVIPITNEWTRQSITLTPKESGLVPAGFFFNSEATQRILEIDKVLIEESSEVNDYFDGDYVSCQWTGVVGFSESSKLAEYEEEGDVSVIDSIMIDPLTPGMAFNIYYSNDLSGNEDGEPTIEEWEQKLWTHVPGSFVATTKKTFVLPEPITCKFVKIEFQYLQPRPYNVGQFQKPVVYKRFPDWVSEVFFAELQLPTFAAKRVGVTYNALQLAYEYYTEDLKNEPLPPILSLQGETEGPNENLVSPQTLSEINTTLHTYVNPPINLAKGKQLLGLVASQSRNKEQVYPTEKEGEFEGPPVESTSVFAKEDIVLDQSFPVMFFYVTCRHEYKELTGEFEYNRAYFAGMQDYAFFRNNYTTAQDTTQYIEAGGDGANSNVNDFVVEDQEWFTY